MTTAAVALFHQKHGAHAIAFRANMAVEERYAFLANAFPCTVTLGDGDEIAPPTTTTAVRSFLDDAPLLAGHYVTMERAFAACARPAMTLGEQVALTLRLLRLKFGRNPEMRQALVHTGRAALGQEPDGVLPDPWAIAADGTPGLLGRLLMHVREELRFGC